MKKPHFSGLILITALFGAFTLGFFLGRNYTHGEVLLSVPASMQTPAPQTTAPTIQTTQQTQALTFPININTATKEELMTLPGIGEVLAQHILTYRTEKGSFKAVEELIHVEGIGEKRLEEILDLITIGG